MKKLKRKQKHKSRPTAILSCLTRTKSTTACTVASISSAYSVYAGFCQETTLHGLKHTVEEKHHWLERCLWFALTVTAFVGAVYCALSQLGRYNSEPVVVSLQRDYRSWWTTFPAVTACFLDRVQQDKAREVIEMRWNVTEDSDPDKYQYYYDFIELVSDVSFRENLQNFWKYQADSTVQGIDLLELALAVHPAFSLQVMVSQADHQVQWHPVMTEVGMCLTYNSLFAEYQRIMRNETWAPVGLLKCHYHSGQCFLRIDSATNAIRYFIHSPYEISTAISNPTGEVLPGEELVIDYKVNRVNYHLFRLCRIADPSDYEKKEREHRQKVYYSVKGLEAYTMLMDFRPTVVEIQASPSVKSLRLEQRRCRYPDEWISDSIQAYSFSLCQMNCRSRMAVMFCGCRPYFHVKGASLGGTTALFVGASVLTVAETALFILRYVVSLVYKRWEQRGRVVQFRA